MNHETLGWGSRNHETWEGGPRNHETWGGGPKDHESWGGVGVRGIMSRDLTPPSPSPLLE